MVGGFIKGLIENHCVAFNILFLKQIIWIKGPLCRMPLLLPLCFQVCINDLQLAYFQVLTFPLICFCWDKK